MQNNSTNEDAERAVTARDVSHLLGLAEITLAQMRARGEGPPFFRCGSRNIRYRFADVIAWRDARTVGREPEPKPLAAESPRRPAYAPRRAKRDADRDAEP